MKRKLILLLKVLIRLILYYLIQQVEREQLEMLRTQPKKWGLLAAAFFISFASVLLGFVRWWLLVRTLGLPFRLVDAFRLGFVGYLMSFVSAGAVGGDLFKAVFIAREQPGRRAEAVATVLVDRVVGLYALLLIASAGILIVGGEFSDPSLKMLRPFVSVATAIGGMCLIALMLPTLTDGWLSQRVSQLPFAGRPVAKVISGVRMYKSSPGVLFIIALCSVGSHLGFAVALYLIAAGLFPSFPPMVEHLFMVPLAMIANAIPLTPGGLGQLEAALERLYEIVPAAPHAASGVLVAMVFRLMTFGIAGVGAVFYILGRAEVQEVMDEAKAFEESQAAIETSTATETSTSSTDEPAMDGVHGEAGQ